MGEAVVTAPPGYWLLTLYGDPDDRREPPDLEVLPVLAWRVPANGEHATPVLWRARDNRGHQWDEALELPDGQCVADDGKVYSSRERWFDGALADWNQED